MEVFDFAARTKFPRRPHAASGLESPGLMLRKNEAKAIHMRSYWVNMQKKQKT